MTDHYGSALANMKHVAGSELTSAEAQVILTAALTHATLALAEQQRVANLIALANARQMNEVVDGTTEASWEAAHALITTKFVPPDNEYPVIAPDIARVLRIEDTNE